MDKNDKNLKIIKIIFTLIICLLGLIALWNIWTFYERDPRTRNGHVRADIVEITTDVSGLITHVFVSSDQKVEKGDLLFQVDTRRFELALAFAEAEVDKAEANLLFANQVNQRNLNLKNLVSTEDLQLSMAKKNEAIADLRLAESKLHTAQLNLERSQVRSPVNGKISYAELTPGSYVYPGKGMLALVDEDSLRVEGYFQETRLSAIKVGNRAKIKLMGSDDILYGTVTSITAAINSSDTKIGSNLLPSISPNFAWVQLAQRIPVRIQLDPEYITDQLVSGRTATIIINTNEIDDF